MGCKLRAAAGFLFGLLLFLFSGFSAFVVYVLNPYSPFPREFNYLVMSLIFLIVLFLLFALVNRLMSADLDLSGGMIKAGTQEEFIVHFMIVLYVTVFYIPVYSRLVIPPLTRCLYRLLGAKIGKNSYPSAAQIGWPFAFFSCGENVIFGEMALLTPHISEKGQLGMYPIKVGHNVTIGARSVILAGVQMGDDAIIAAGSVVPKFTKIGSGEIWGGVPAKRIAP